MYAQDLYLTQYDENMLDVTFQHGKSQLQQIRVTYKWKNTKIKNKLPILECHWYNKTQKTVEQIHQFSQEFYQPSVVDVGTTIFVQVMPQNTPHLQYIGMPFSKNIGPIQLSQQTQQQVNELIQAGKSTFFIQIKEINLKRFSEKEQQSVQGLVPISECLLKVVKDQLILFGKSVSMQKAESLLQITISKDYPQLVVDRKSPRFLKIILNAEEHTTLILQNHRVRDVLCLLTRMIAQKQMDRQLIQTEVKISTQSSQSKQQLKEQKQAQQTKSQKQLQLTATTLEQITPKKINQQKQLAVKVNREDKSPTKQQLSPKKKDIKDTQNILIIAQLRDKLSMLQTDLLKYQKQNESYKSKQQEILQKNKYLQQELSRCQNQLQTLKQNLKYEDQIKKKNSEKMCYLDNQCRILQQELAQTNYQCKILTSKLQETQQRIRKQLPSANITSQNQQQYLILTYDELIDLVIKKQEQINETHFKAKYHLEKIDQLQAQLKETKIYLQTIQSHNKQLLKKIESILQQKQLVKVQTDLSQQNRLNSLKLQTQKLKQDWNMKQQFVRNLQRDNHSLKIQVKQLIEQNYCFRSKQKSSKHDLKLQIAELKKLVNRFTQTITDKDLQIDHLKNTNKQISKCLTELQKKTQL